MIFFARILWLAVSVIAITILPLPAAFGAVLFGAVSFSWFWEAVVFGLVVDALSGLPLGAFFSFFFLLVIFLEVGKLYLRNEVRFDLVSSSAVVMALFGLLQIFFYGIIYGAASLLTVVFYADLFKEWLMAGAVLFLLVIFRMIINIFNDVLEQKIFRS